MNELLGICEILEGYSGEDLGFNVLEAEKCNETWKLTVERYSKGLESPTVERYSKGLESPTEQYNNTLIVLAERLYNKYSSTGIQYEIIACSKFCKETWCLTIQELKELKDEKSNCEEE